MELTRRNFIKGFGAAALVGTALTVAGVSVDDAVNVGRVYFFPKNIRIAKSLAESNYFVRVDMPVHNNPWEATKHFKISDDSSWSSAAMIRREIYDPKEFYADKHCLPIKVEYLTEKEASPEYTVFNNSVGALETSPKIVHNPDGSKWTYGRPVENQYDGTRGKDWGRIVLTDA